MATIKIFLASIFILVSCHVYASESAHDLIHFSKKKEDILVVKVSSADSIVLEEGRRIKLIGIESAGPAPIKPRLIDNKGHAIEQEEDVVVPLEEQALSYAQELMEGKKIKLEFDVDLIDAQGNRIAYVFLSDDRLANAELLRQGFVHLKIRPPNIKHSDQLRKAYMEAKRELRGFLSN